MNTILKHDCRELALCERERLGLTQRQMAERLAMSERSYADIESGASACGALTVVLLLMGLINPSEFLQKLRKNFDLLFVLKEVG